MKVILCGDKYNELNKIHKNCLKYTDSIDYIDKDDVEKRFMVYNEDNLLVGTVEACLSEDKAGLQIMRFKTQNKSLGEQEQMIKMFTDYIWDFKNINHFILAIYIYM